MSADKPVTIGDQQLGEGRPTYVIAEAGANWNAGDSKEEGLERAKRMIEVAAEAGADAVKFQTYRAERMYVKESGVAEYLGDTTSIYNIIQDNEMPYEWIEGELPGYAQEHGIDFLSTPFDEKSADKLEKHVPAYKIASYTMSHHPFLRYIASKGKPVVMSTGAHNMKEVREAVEVFEDEGFDQLGLFQCVAAYPTPPEDINVKVVETLKQEFGVPVGLSDHTGIDPETGDMEYPVAAPATAVALGADMVEKHFTLDRSLDGPDQAFAVEPGELEEMVQAIRKVDELKSEYDEFEDVIARAIEEIELLTREKVEKVLGSGEKKVLEVEEELHDIARRRVHATQDIEEGETITEENTAVLRSGEQEPGVEPKFYDLILGSTATSPISRDDGVTWDKVDADLEEG